MTLAAEAAPGRTMRLHADVRLAARIVAPVWPLERFVAVNPLGGLVDRPIEEASAEARRWRGVRTHLDLATARRLATEQGIGDAELAAALAEVAPAVGELPDLHLAGRSVPAAEVAIADLWHGPEATALPPIVTFGSRAATPLSAETQGAIDAVVASWCATFVDDHAAAWAMSSREEGLYRAWRQGLEHDPRLRRLLGRRAVTWLGWLPADPADALDAVLTTLCLGEDDRTAELTAQLARLPGWAGHARWQDEWAALDRPGPRLRLLDLVAVRATLEAAALLHPGRGSGIDPLAVRVTPVDLDARARQEAAVEQGDLDLRTEVVCGHLDARAPNDREAVRAVLALLPGTLRHMVWTTAREARFRDRLLHELTAHPAASDGGSEAAPGRTAPARPDAQLLCCIDVRSEGLRRKLEERGSYDTLGVAGFFGMPATWQPLGSWQHEPRAPVLLTPSERVTEAPVPAHREAADEHLRGSRVAGAVDDATHTASYGVAAPFAYAEAAGWITGPLALLRTLLPARWRRPVSAPPPIRVVLDGPGGFSLERRVALAEALLTTVGLTDGLARLVVFCGHGARTTNNPHAASLDCGACGGAPGGASARIASAVCNDPGVRHALAQRGLAVPEDTWFVAAEHDTVADRVTVLDRELVPRQLEADLATLEADLEAAGTALAAERAAVQPGLDEQLRTRGRDWAQVRPEWGLAGNAAFIVGPRTSTLGLDLQRRVFLHSYRADRDPEGAALETILTAPLVVAHWINAQYLFSTVDPDGLGAGDKLLHNPIAGVGVTLGDGGDLRTGLPQQSTRFEGRPVHDPLRLLALVEAPRSRTAAIVARNAGLRDLVEHGWIHLVGRDGPSSPWFRLRPGGQWDPWEPVGGPPSQPPGDTSSGERAA
jgi:uncharacterized protein YbcC (UPF0753/DUF2309 family)